MGFFTVGNLLTLGIVILVLILNRHLDKRRHSLDKMTKYAEKLKADLKAFTDIQEEAVRNYGIDLKIEKDAARELLNRIQITDKDLGEKAAAIDHIEERLEIYERSLEELAGMTNRVQENIGRIRDESAFVEGAARRVSEAKTGLEALERSLESLEIRVERDNAEALEKTAEAVIASVKSSVSDLEALVETIERKAGDHREAVEKIEQERAESLARDMGIVEKTLRNAVEQAGLRADRMEEAALVKLKEQAQDRIHRLQHAEEERLKTYQESAKNRIAEAQNLVKTFREEWKTERQEWDARDKAIREEWKQDLQEMKNIAAETEKLFTDIKARTAETAAAQDAWLLKAVEDMKQKALEVTGARLEEYRQAQDAEFKRLEALTEDSRKLDAELRRSMQDVIAKVREDFAAFDAEAADARKAVAAEFNAAAAAFRADIKIIDEELAEIKNKSYENVSEKLQVFEKDFFADLSKRSDDIESRLAEWQDTLDTRLTAIGGEAEGKRRETETRLTEEMRKELTGRNDRILGDLERLKTEAGAFEEAIRGRMDAADDSLVSYKAELEHSLQEARENAERTIKSEIGAYALSAAETVKQNQRDLEKRLQEISDYVENRSGELGELMDATRRNLADIDNRAAAARQAMEDVYKDADVRRAELFSRADEQAKTLETGVKDAERRIREFFDQTKLIDRAAELKAEMERRIEDLRDDIDRLDQRRNEAAQLESQFVKIRRLEDEVNAKMTRFLSEKHRIEQMEADFNRLIQISRAVDEKLTQVTASDDVLQQMQVQVRRLEESLQTAEEKFQRIEKKNQVLETTNDGIDRNFKALQEAEKTLKTIRDDMDRLGAEEESLSSAVEALAAANDKAKETAEQIAALDKALDEIGEKTKAMQTAREWIARAETRLGELNKQAQTQFKVMEALMKGKKTDDTSIGEGAPSIRIKEAVIQLIQQGWKPEAIAKTMKISLGEVELIQETFAKE
jgi:chromosome segregation ATPase